MDTQEHLQIGFVIDYANGIALEQHDLEHLKTPCNSCCVQLLIAVNDRVRAKDVIGETLKNINKSLETLINGRYICPEDLVPTYLAGRTADERERSHYEEVVYHLTYCRACSDVIGSINGVSN